MVLDTITLKQLNKDLVREAIRNRDFSQKNIISRETGLSVATCSNIIQELLEDEEIYEIESAESTGGRPSRQFVYNKDYTHLALMYVSSEGPEIFIFTAVMNMKGELINSDFRPRSEITLKEVDTVVSSLLEADPKISIISCGIPGIVQGGNILACDFPALSGISLGQHLEEKFSLKVVVENDVNLAVMGYYGQYQQNAPESLAFLYYPENRNAGAGIVINGNLVKGATQFAGEVSYMPTWLNRDEQMNSQKDEIFHEFIGDTILSINCLLNPELIIVSARWFFDEFIKKLEYYLKENSPFPHIPNIKIDTDFHESYLNGLKYIGFRQMNCGLEVVKSTI